MPYKHRPNLAFFLWYQLAKFEKKRREREDGQGIGNSERWKPRDGWSRLSWGRTRQINGTPTRQWRWDKPSSSTKIAKTKESRVEKRVGDYEEKAEDAELGDVETTAELLIEVVELTLQVGRMGPHVDKSAGNENDEEEHGVARGYRPPLIPKATRNANSPSANKVLAQLGEEMR
ncbi:hypothetical protein PC121_g17728 [Phytophthora cactorum]|nr:hypothetical protein PC120_g15255 [Phytophthora cactorum]KAG3051687.1 hypothetical protein PC121_g17728 [Phytophthora cactorum]